MKMSIFDVVEMVGALFLLFGSLYVVYAWYEIIGIISLSSYFFIAFLTKAISYVQDKEKIRSENHNLDGEESRHKKRIFDELRDDEKGMRWITVVFEIPLSALIATYVYYNVQDGMLYILLFLLASTYWTKLRLGHSVFDRIAAHEISTDEIDDMKLKIEKLEDEIDYKL